MPGHTELEQRKRAARTARGKSKRFSFGGKRSGFGGKTTGIQNALSRPNAAASGSLSNRQSVLTNLLSGKVGSSGGGSLASTLRKKRRLKGKGGLRSGGGGFDPSRAITR